MGEELMTTPRKRKATAPPPPGSRSERIVELARQGWKLKAIADEVGCTKGSVSAMLNYYGEGSKNPAGRPRQSLDCGKP
jgi:DNA-binding NarL/FixJ family response regulator